MTGIIVVLFIELLSQNEILKKSRRFYLKNYLKNVETNPWIFLDTLNEKSLVDNEEFLG